MDIAVSYIPDLWPVYVVAGNIYSNNIITCTAWNFLNYKVMTTLPQIYAVLVWHITVTLQMNISFPAVG